MSNIDWPMVYAAAKRMLRGEDFKLSARHDYARLFAEALVSMMEAYPFNRDELEAKLGLTTHTRQRRPRPAQPGDLGVKRVGAKNGHYDYMDAP